MRFLSACLLVFLIVFAFSTTDVLARSQYSFPKASEGQINEALQKTVPLRFLPSHPLYFLISMKEAINRLFQPSALKRSQFDLVVSGKRLKEAYLLLEKNDLARSSKTLERYSKRLEKMINQMEKARAQNQETAALVDEIAENLRVHENIFFAIGKRWQMEKDQYDFDTNLEGAVSSFTKAVLSINNLKPGLKDRFKTVTGAQQQDKDYLAPSPSPILLPLQATSSARPRRIIY